jgi:ATPase subunit of ABC transporter with duplicated ATPase domains
MLKWTFMQKTLSLKNIEYAVHEKPILQGVTFRCSEKERLCVFGENGAGKSTLLKILCGEIVADSGTIEKQGHIRLVYVAQEFDQKYDNKSIEEYIKSEGSEALFKRVFQFAKELGFNAENNKGKLCGSLSGGQQKIVAISVALSTNPDFLLLDEPENHLDIVSRMELISLLSDYKGGVIFISHDRLLIDALATKVGEMAEGKLNLSEGGYDDYIEMKMKRIGGLQREFDKEAKRIRQLSANIVILQQKAFRGKEVSAYRRAKEELDGLKKDHKESGRPDDKKTKIRLSETAKRLHDGKLLCRIKEGMYKYPNAKAKTFGEVDLEVRSGDKIVLLGRNGSGKSTFLKCLTGELTLKAGEITWVSGVTHAYFNQHAEFDPEKNAIEVVSELLRCMEVDAQAALGAMRFDLARMKSPVRNLSGGERMRLRFAIAFGKKPDFLILDEPTNHIDEVTWEILLQACINSKSSILLVTHDYEFIKAFNPALFWMMHDQKIVPRYKDLDVLLSEMKGE